MTTNASAEQWCYSVYYQIPDSGWQVIVVRTPHAIYGTAEVRQIERALHASGRHCALVIAYGVLPHDWQPTGPGDPDVLAVTLTTPGGQS